MPRVEIWCRVTVIGPQGTVLGTWEESGIGAPDLGVVDRLSRVRLAAGRVGWSVVVHDVSADLVQLLGLVGLDGEMVGQPEAGKDPLCVQKRVEPTDPPT
jgi:hypothetical protein